MNWEARSGKNYLYRRIGKSGKSLGPRSSETEATLKAFSDNNQQLERRQARLADQLNTQSAILRLASHTDTRDCS
ncbi:hypothetical protein Z949_292 [Sulfitobacter guttiformis KCTC 32187]|nr:hypothetical protein Z949_292 [Sulfitobacter guttiformis KCTC 32187]